MRRSHRENDAMTDEIAFDPACSICRSPTQWTHRVDEQGRHFRKWGKGHTMRSVWSFCAQCEDFYQTAQDDELFVAMARWQERTPAEVEDYLQETLAAFRLADLGPHPYEQPDLS